MKKLAILAIFLILSLTANAAIIEQEFSSYESIEVPGHNITIMGISGNRDSVVVCINNQRHIIGKNAEKEILNIKIEATRIYETNTKIRIIYHNDGEACDESCSNTRCFQNQNIQDENTETQNTSLDSNKNITIPKNQQIKKSLNLTILSISLMMLAIILLLIFLIKKRGRFNGRRNKKDSG